MPVLKLLWLGPPAIEWDGRPLRLEMRKTLALLAYLSLSPQNPTRETLAALFWPEYDQQHALANLRRHLSSLTRSLPGEFIETDREKIGLCRGEWLTIDVYEFQEQLAFADELSHATQKLSEGISVYEKAAALYQGDFLEGFNLKDCPGFDDWQFFQRESLRSEYAGLLEKLASACQQAGEWEKAIAYSRSWLALDRLNEPAQRLLMNLYFLSGQKSAALRQYEECQRILEQDLGQPPEPETLKLYEEIRKGKPPEAQRTQPPLVENPPAGKPDIPLTKTKFFLPKVPRSLLHRQRLVSRLNRCVQLPLTLLSASAGFGKTTLLAEWAAQAKYPIAWVSLDRSDNDPNRLVEYIANAVRNVLPSTKAGTVTLSLLRASQPVQVPVIVGSLINDLVSIPNPLILILDDYHNIDSLAAHDVVNFLLDHRPENLHLVIATRSDPPLSLARLRANLQLGEIRIDDLRFTNEETQLFLTQAIGFPLSAQDIAFFENKVEGWIAGIQMAALVLQSGNLSPSSSELDSFMRAFKGSQRHILDYLIEEVLNRQPEEIRTFLLHTSILEKLCSRLCDSLLDRDRPERHPQLDELDPAGKRPSQEILEFLERSNLFLIPLDDERNWYRYHHLFSDLLRVRLQQHEPRLEAALHKRAANWYAQNSYSLEAVKHALSSGDYAYAADLIEEFSLKLIWMNQIVTTLEWFKWLPAEVVESRPLLTIYQAFLLARRGEFERVEAILANAEAFIETLPSSQKTDEYKILIFGMRAFMANLRGEPEKSLRFGAAILTLKENQHTQSFFLALTQLAVAYLDSGDLLAAERTFTEMADWAQSSQDVYYAILTNKELAEIWSLRGRLSQAEQVYQQMEDWIQQTVHEPVLYKGLIYVYRANLLIEKNELRNARQLMQDDLESLLSVWRTTSLYFGYTVLAYLHTALRNFDQAKSAVEKANQLVTSQQFYPRNRSAVTACQVNLWLAEGRLAEAQSWAQLNYPQLPDHFPFLRELDHICLARVLVASCRWEEAYDLLQRLAQEAEAGKRFGRLLKINLLQALALHGLGRPEKALNLLDVCLDFACPEGYRRVFLDEGAPMKALIQRRMNGKAWQDPQLKDYAIKLIEAF